jgi:hypothetical protein
MNEDKELLDLAAKAAGIELLFEEMKDGSIYYYYKIPGDTQGWNPLNSDSDALRLAVKLGLGIEFFSSWVAANGGHEEDRESDPYAATRRAIVRAAAEIGRGME